MRLRNGGGLGEPNWHDRLEVRLEPCVERLRHTAQHRWASIDLQGLLGPGERKSLEPMASRVAPGGAQHLHPFISTSSWPTAPREEVLVQQANEVIGAPDAVLVCERRPEGERKSYLAHHPDHTSLETLAAHLKARWVCEQAHQQRKEERGLDPFEGRSWVGLHHHGLLTMMALCFRHYLRLEGFRRGEKGRNGLLRRPRRRSDPAGTAAGALASEGGGPPSHPERPRHAALLLP